MLLVYYSLKLYIEDRAKVKTSVMMKMIDALLAI